MWQFLSCATVAKIEEKIITAILDAGLWVRIDFNPDPDWDLTIVAQSGSTKSLNPDQQQNFKRQFFFKFLT
jgi:hypothetical protein